MDNAQTKIKWYVKLLPFIYDPKKNSLKTDKNTQGLEKIILAGNPNVGKSVLYNILTGAFHTVSDYSGTTMEISRGKGKIKSKEYEIIDTPGIYSLMCRTEEEKVTRNLLLSEQPKIVLHVVDAKNIQRMLPLTFQFIESDLPVILVLNIMDEAIKAGLKIDIKGLEKELGIPVVPTAAALNMGIDILKERIDNYVATSETKVWGGN
jgi:ferrous iron transport protein B